MYSNAPQRYHFKEEFIQAIQLVNKSAHKKINLKHAIEQKIQREFDKHPDVQFHYISNKVLLFHICRIFIHINETTKIRIHSKDAVELFSKNNILIGDIASELFNCNPGQIGKITYLLNPKELLHILKTVYKKGSF